MKTIQKCVYEHLYKVVPPKRYKLIYKPHEYYRYITNKNHSEIGHLFRDKKNSGFTGLVSHVVNIARWNLKLNIHTRPGKLLHSD